MASKPISTAAGIRNLPTPDKGQADHSDSRTPGLFVRVSSNGTKSFVCFYRLDGKQRRDTIGRFVESAKDDDIGSLAWARAEADTIRALAANGTDPRERRDAAKAEARQRRADTYGAAVEDYIKARESNRPLASAYEIKRVLLKEGDDWKEKPVSAITPRDVRTLLDAIRDGGEGSKPRPYLANRTYAYMRTFFAWCAEPGIEKINRSPMEGLKRPWDGEQARDRHYDDDELAALWHGADKLDERRGAFVKLLLLLGKRKGALAAMRWDELDLEKGVWTPADAVPPMARRGKQANKRVHAVPLPKLAVRILSVLSRVEGNPFVFVGRRRGGHIDPGTPFQSDVKEATGVADFYWHGVRHSVETGMSQLEILPFVRDMILDHAPGRGSGAGYDHNLYIEQMRPALEQWADHVAGLVAGENVAVLR